MPIITRKQESIVGTIHGTEYQLPGRYDEYLEL